MANADLIVSASIYQAGRRFRGKQCALRVFQRCDVLTETPAMFRNVRPRESWVDQILIKGKCHVSKSHWR